MEALCRYYKFVNLYIVVVREVKYLKYLAGVVMLLLMVPSLTTSCVKDEVLKTDGVVLRFSSDTVAFDTVFVTMGTVTKQVRVYNGYDQPVLISAVTLRGGAQSRFRLNVDGDTSMVVRNIEIAAHDSIFVFVQANINPNASDAPFLVEDAILFDCNGTTQSLPLTAYGRNAVYHNPTLRIVNQNGDLVAYGSYIDCDHWDHTRPHVIFGYAMVGEGATLRLQAGDELYFAPEARLYVRPEATLRAEGSPTHPVLFTSMRHDGWYDTLPGQWYGVLLAGGSRGSVIDWACVENGTVGVQVDTNVDGSPTLVISNTRVENHSVVGIVGQAGARIEGDNLLVTNCGTATLVLQYGGSYHFANSTFADYWGYNGNGNNRTNPSVILNNYYTSGRPLERAWFDNCVIYGNYGGSDGTGEILLDIDPATPHNIRFNNCLVKSTLIDHLATECILNRDPGFDTVGGRNYHLSPDSPCRGAGNAAYVTRPYDLDNVPRGTPPSIGAFESPRDI